MAEATKPKRKVVTSDIIAMLAKRYPPPEWASAAEVADGTGARATRRCDFFAMNCYPSKGLARHGHEVKVTRGDWLREIQDPEKAATFERRCDYWWIVAPAGVVELSELPVGWGYMQASQSALRVKKSASRIEAEPIDTAWMASLLRATQDQSPSHTKALERQAYAAGAKRGEELGRQRASSDSRKQTREQEALAHSVKRFEEVSGVKLDAWNGVQLGEAVNLLLPHLDRHGRTNREVQRLIDQAQRAVDEMSAIKAARDLLWQNTQSEAAE